MDKTIDNFWEHEKHFKYDSQCSECYREKRLINAHQVVNKVSPWIQGSRYEGRPILPNDEE
jgi:hypothetical protein